MLSAMIENITRKPNFDGTELTPSFALMEKVGILLTKQAAY